MARKGKRFRNQRRFSGIFQCTCGYHWLSTDIRVQESQECERCSRDVWPTEVHLVSAIDSDGLTAQVDVRYFGQYQCFKCLRTWFSAHSWLGFGQQCRNCHISVEAHRLRQLKRPKGMDTKNDQRRGHESQLCSKCRRLGHNCTNYKSIVNGFQSLSLF